MSVHAACVVMLTATLGSVTTLRIAVASDRQTALYRAPTPYTRPGRAPLNSVIITSRPLSLINDTSPSAAVQWRRQMSVHSVLRSHAAPAASNITFYTVDCGDARHCSETIAVDAPAVPTPTFKPYSQELLDKFMKQYADKIKHDAGTTSLRERLNDRELTNDGEEVDEVPTNRLANLYLQQQEDGKVKDEEGQDEQKDDDWDLVPAEKHNHPYDDRQGWVTLEPVPWSSSKVSKWHSQAATSNKRPPVDQQQSGSHWNDEKPVKPTWERPPSYWNSDKPKPWDNDRPSKPWDSDRPSKPSWDSDRPSKPWDSERPTKPSWENDRPSKPSWDSDRPSKPSWDSDRPSKPWDNDRPSKPSWDSDRPSKPWDSDRPSKPWDSDRPTKPSWENDRPSKPSWENDRPSKPFNYERPSKPWDNDKPNKPWDTKPYSKPSSDQAASTSLHFAKPSSGASSHQGDIITDNRPSSWPADQSRPSSSYQNRPWEAPGHPATHPAVGPGEWVLLSSTKGYSLPARQRSGKRSMAATATLTATRGVRLTVLPAENTTTSHGGMLEVQSSFQTVDEAHEEHRKSRLLADQAAFLNASTQPTFSSPPSPPLADEAVVVEAAEVGDVSTSVAPPPQRQIVRQGGGNRRNAMLAAVGAGMVPATMALLVPMMMGRKKREAVAEQRMR